MRIIRSNDPLSHPEVVSFLELLRQGKVTSSGREADVDVREIVSSIIARVKEEGDQALCELEEALDGAKLRPETLRVPEERILSARAEADPAFMDLVGRVRRNVQEYQQAILHGDPPMLKRESRRLGLRYTPLDRVAVYVPGGRAFYPSTVLMTVVPAQVAGVPEIAISSPPTSSGEVHPEVLALAAELGVTEVYRLGGALAVGALAWGTETVKPVDKIVGPGNAFVAEAKRQVFGRVGIDMIAGPSEVLILADETADADWIASDLLAQAEHDPGSAVLVTTSSALADSVKRHLGRRLRLLNRQEALSRAMQEYCLGLVVEDLEAACGMVNAFAPEHLQIWLREEEKALSLLRHAGAVFLGPHTPVPVGDYFAGPSHVLPTGSTARFSSPLSCNDFLKSSSIIQYGEADLRNDGPQIVDFAQREGLTAHAEAVRARLESLRE